MTFSKTHDFPPELVAFLRKDVKRHKDVGHTLNRLELSFFSKGILNTYLRPWGLLFEYAMLFTWKAGELQPLHIDGTPPDRPRNASLNLLIKGGEDAVFEWYEAEVMDQPLISNSGIAAFQIKPNTETLIHREPLQKCSAVRTNIPHRVTNFTTDTHLLCLRVHNNPTIDQF